MAIIVEDGSIVPGANSLVSVADFAAYALLIGVDITGDPSIHLIKAMEFINDHESQLIGFPVDRDQTTAYPRSGLVIQGWSWSSTEIPRQAIQLQKNLALEYNAGRDPWNPPEADDKVVKRERIEGAIDIEYAVREGGNGKLSKDSSWSALLKVLIRNHGLYLIK